MESAAELRLGEKAKAKPAAVDVARKSLLSMAARLTQCDRMGPLFEERSK